MQCQASEITGKRTIRCEKEATRKSHGFHFCEEHYKVFKKSVAPEEKQFFQYSIEEDGISDE